MLTVEEIINIGKVSQFLTANHIAKKGLWGSGLDLRRPRLLYMTRKNVEWMYNLDPDNDTLVKTANYLYAISWNNLKALNILNIAGGGGTVSPVSPTGSNLPNPYDWIVSSITTADAPLKEGDTTITLDGTNGTRDFRGYNIEFYRGSQPDYTTNPQDGSVYYSWNRTLGIFTLLNGAAQIGEPMRIAPVLGIATSSPASDPTTVTYNLVAATEIANLDNNNLLVSVIISPNGFTYTWASDFVFTDNFPEQPGAIAAGTTQIYTFMKVNSKWICFNQTLNGVV